LARLPHSIVNRIHDVVAELRTLVDGGPSALAMVPRALSELVHADVAGAGVLGQHGDRVRVERGFDHGTPRNLFPAYDGFLAGEPVPWGTYNLIRPDPVQRNRIVGLDTIGRLAGVRTLEEIPVYREFYTRVGLDKADQLRVLVCDGPSLLALVSVFRHERFTDLERRTMQRLVPALQRRLCVERSLANADCTHLLLDAAIAAIPTPAFVTDALGTVVEANATGQLWLQTEGRGGREVLREATRRARHPLYDVTPVAAPGAPRRCLLVQRGAGDMPVKLRAAQAAARWSLTRRQSEVLALVVEGLPTRTMAAVLGVSERAVEAHLTAIFEKAQVETRAELASTVWRA
jgi:DNA-binding CsgD family transcriptional regulator